jgi:hypothetical protein
MREYDEYHQILELWEMGMPKKRIAITLGIPRRTVIDCINRYGTVKGLEADKERASRSTPDEVLAKIQTPENIEVQQAYAYVLGMYLGDGYIVRNKRIYYLRISLDTAYPHIIETCYQKIQTLLPNNKVNVVYSKQGNWCEVVCTYKFWPDIFPQHGAGMKHTREIRLEDWQQTIADTYALEMFRGLFHSDGSRFSNIVKGKDYPRYQFSNNSDGIIKLFCRTCDLLGVHWTEKHLRAGIKNRATDIYISLRQDVEYLDSVVGPKR